MTPWNGWSTDPAEVNATRVLAGLFDSIEDDEATTTSTGVLVQKLGITNLNPSSLAVRLVERGLFHDTLTDDFDQNLLLITELGRGLRGKFRTRPPARARAARKALLEWLYEHGTDDFAAAPVELLKDEALGWFYGVRFTVEEVNAATDRLRDLGSIETFEDDSGYGIRVRARLTDAGRQQAEDNLDEMDSTIARGSQVNINNWNQSGGGNAFFPQAPHRPVIERL